MALRGALTRSAGLALALCALVTAPALAGGQTQQFSLSGSDLVRGGAPLPQFHLDFLLDDPARQALLPPESVNNLEISLTSPDSGVLRFLFSPRPQLGLSVDRATGGNRAYAGLTWSLFDSDTVFGNVGLAGTYEAGSSLPTDPLRRPLGPPLMLHGAVEFGYHLGERDSVSLSLDQGRAPDLRPGVENDNFRLRYGLKF